MDVSLETGKGLIENIIMFVI